ncbi:MAG: RNA-directed DNA polymerase [Mesorhizobium sp.]|uniref:retron Ec67 family RNA-directed DNA polymerase/endonuclease n=1 Tax=Mesorhizobium sp. TaxID=1871066 RepID=UPI000FE5B174|nr:retron Ec67 family RNA-directed DNA polymerase/endonuclease [Mesorhizobium sp.]RWO94618.1 MAG: RNA-directed DNA polymerase [Mesorhizobium sp.]TIM50004.1 MAG: RNA-directed DNA polymerase [Mesorhizobium sp.]
MSELAKLKSCSTLPQLARLLGVKGETLSSVLYWLKPSQKYVYFTIPKKSGTRRLITAPTSRLKYVQGQLTELLGKIEAELEGRRTTKYCVLSHGFKKGFSIVTNADVHRNRRHVFNADLRDFFPSINFGRVYGFFQKDRNFNLSPKIATIIAQIACHDNQLPQGSPCSPVISNLIAHMLDIKLNRIASAGHCSYTRYADDLTFSTNEKDFPPWIARLVRGSHDKWVAGDLLLERIYRSGFSLNEAKTRMQHRNSRQDTTGLIVNQKLNVRNEYYKLARAMCHQLFTDGFCYAGRDRAYVPDTNLEGMMAFIYQIRKIKIENFKADQAGFSKLYGRFLDYRSFYGLGQPRIICEGKTDNIYIRSALKALAAKYPSLIDPGKQPPLKVDLFNYTKRSAIFQDLSGGSDELKKLIGNYATRISRFKHGAVHPVLMIVDNDAGSVGLFQLLTKMLGKPIGGLDPFYHVIENLYVVPIPKTAAPVAIEDLFDPALLSRQIDGKDFDRTGKEKDGSKWYGKNEFATKIVAPERGTIKFDGFEPLLNAVVDAIQHYEGVKAAAAAKATALKAAKPALVAIP